MGGEADQMMGRGGEGGELNLAGVL